MNETRTLAEYAVDAKAAEIPAHVRERAAALVLDQLGCQVAGVQMPWSQEIHNALRPLSATGPSTVVGHEESLAPDAAAFLNSAFGHSNESDDTHLKTPTHPGAVVIPAALAVAESVGATGEEFLAAVVTGYEVMLRVSYSVSPYLIAQGHHPPPAVGPFGAAAAAARLMSLSADQTLNALSIAGSHSAGLLEYTQTGGSVKRLHCAIPAQAGVRSALLAANGVTGPPTVLEGDRGFCRVFAPNAHLDRLVDRLGERYILLETSIKSYSCCHLIHAALDGIRELRERRPFGAGDVASVRVATRTPSLIPHVGVIKQPPDVLAAQFSMSFSLAMLLSGMDCWWWDYERVDLQDPGLLDLSQRIETVLEDGTDDVFFTGLRITVELTDGSRLETTVAHAVGEPERPLTPEQLHGKFHTLAEPVIGPERSAGLVEAIEQLWAAPDVRRVGELLRAS